jgi:hypothetical protein
MNLLFPPGLIVRDSASFLVVTDSFQLGGADTAINVRLPDGKYHATWSAQGYVFWKSSYSHTMHDFGFVRFDGEDGELVFRYAAHSQYHQFSVHDGCQFTLTKVGPFVEPAEQPVQEQPVKSLLQGLLEGLRK